MFEDNQPFKFNFSRNQDTSEGLGQSQCDTDQATPTVEVVLPSQVHFTPCMLHCGLKGCEVKHSTISERWTEPKASSRATQEDVYARNACRLLTDAVHIAPGVELLKVGDPDNASLLSLSWSL